MGEGRIGGDTRRYTVRDAADILGITTGAVRNRLSRGTLQSIKEGDTVYVVLLERYTERDTGDIPGESTALISAKDDPIATLQEQLQAEREANRENRRINAALTSRIPEIEAPREPSRATEPREAPKEGTEQPGRVESQPSVEGAQEPAEPRPWWRRVFGG